MFVAHETEVPLDVGAIEHLIDRTRDGAVEPGDAAFMKDGKLSARVSPWEEGVNRTVTLDIGMPEIHRSGLVYPIRWTAEGGGGLFPSLTGELTLSQAGRERTTVRFQGNYEPPLGPLGKVVDRVALGRLADTSVRHWLEELCTSLADLSAA